MKFRHFFPALCSALLMFSCITPDKPKEPDEPDTPEVPDDPAKDKPGPGVYKFVIPDYSSKASVGQGGKTAWEEGDEILVSGGYYPGAVTVKLKASEISGDGKTATVTLDKVPESTFDPDKFYAAWPAGLIDPESSFTEDTFDFTATDAPLMCAYLSGDTFNFEHICAAISFSAGGNYDGCVFSGLNWEMVAYDKWSVQINSDSPNYRRGKSISDYFLRKDLKNGGATLYFPYTLNLGGGFRIYMRKGDTYPKLYTYSGDVKLNRGEILALGDISSKLEDYSGPAPELPKMPVLKSTTRIDVKEVPELSGLCLTADGSALWTVGDNGWFGQVSFDGKVTKYWTKSADMEGITIDPETGDLYIANEPNTVTRLKPPYEKPASWEVVITVTEAKGYGNSGMEGISYYKDGMLFVGTQTSANVWIYKTDGTMVKGPVSLRKLYSGIVEVGGLCYDAVNDWLWISDSETHKVFVFDAELTHMLAEYSVPMIHNNESVCVDHRNNCVWVGLDDDDLCAIFRLDFTGLNP